MTVASDNQCGPASGHVAIDKLDVKKSTVFLTSTGWRDTPGRGLSDSIVRAALTKSRDGIDFADAVIAELGRVSGCEYTVTFDRRAAQTDEMRLLEPRTSTG